MTAEPRLTYIEATGQVVQDYLTTGAAGGAWLRPAPDIELIFDRVTGRLCRLTVFAGTPAADGTLTQRGAAFLAGHFGNDAPERVRRAASRRRPGAGLGPLADPGGALSALARLRAGRATSPVSSSPWWDAQEARLALEAGMDRAARAAAVRAARSLAQVELPAITDRQAAAALAAADLARPDDAAAARRVRARVEAAAELSVDEYLRSRPAAAARPAGRAGDPAPDGISAALDLTMVPAGTFLPALTAGDDLLVRAGARPGTVAVTARPAADADRNVLRRCRARLVLPAERRVLSQGAFSWAGPVAVAELSLPPRTDGLRGAWIEVVGDEHRPVRSARMRLIKRALRAADAALRAARQPRGLAPHLTSGQWAELAAAGWRQSADDWRDAGDADRARLAGQAGPETAPQQSIAEEAGW